MAPEPEYELTDRDRAILAFEQQWPRHSAKKEDAILKRFKVSAARYIQLRSELVKRPEALSADPVLVNRIIRTTEANARSRASRTLRRRADQ